MDFPRKIYAIKHNVTNRVYIGSSCKVDKRLQSHINALRGHRHVVEDMQFDFDEYGEDYTITILDEICEYEDKFKEYEWMDKYQSYIRGKGYNYKDHIKRRIKKSTNTTELLKLIREDDNPEQAVLIAIDIIRDFLTTAKE